MRSFPKSLQTWLNWLKATDSVAYNRELWIAKRNWASIALHINAK
jgi:hypothetical protein